MVDYYKVLGVRRHASAREVKSAYRRLARERHPDVNGGSEKSAREFALLTVAYRTLTDPQKRAYHNSKLLRRDEGFANSSVFQSNNLHAQRMRRVAVQARMDKVVDNYFLAERRENFAMQQAVFTTVSLFLSTFFVALFKPQLWQQFEVPGRALLLALFAASLWHLVSRLRAYFRRYTYQPNIMHDSVTDEPGGSHKPFTRFAASSFLVVGYLASLGMGLLVGQQMNDFLTVIPVFKDPHLRPELLFYPPIAVLIVDTLHTIASKID